MALKINNEFRKELEKYIEGATAKLCYQCGTCSGGCPAFRFTGKFNPRRLIEDILLGFKDRIINDPTVWLCCACHTCLEACPQGVMVSEVMRLLRNKATEAGNYPDGLTAEIKSLLETACVNPLSPAIERRRDKMGLPKNPQPPVEEVKKLLEITKLTQYLPKE